jgi:hypothetical protein
MKNILFIILTLSLPILAFSQSASLSFQHPQQTWKYATGIIQDARLVIQPFGSYTKNDLTMTFSSKGMPAFQPNDSLEIRLQFNHIEGSNFTDMFLWIGDSAVQAIIADRAKAKATYENIVKRRQDPALLERVSTNTYKLSIYPMRADSSRKVMLSYFTPGTLSDSNLTTVIPHWILRSSAVVQFNTSVIVRNDSLWKEPVLRANVDIPFTPAVDPQYGQVLSAVIPPNVLVNSPNISVAWKNSAVTLPYFVEKYTGDSSGVYQVSVQPGKLFGLTMMGKKFLFLVNYDSMSGSSAYSRKEIVGDLISVINSQLTPSDSYNVLFSGKNGPIKLRPSWIAVQKESTAAILNAAKLSPDFLNGFDITKLFFTAAEMLKGDKGNIILISSSEEYWNKLSAANKFADTLTSLLPPKTQIHIVDNNQWYRYFYVNGKYYFGNQYLYDYLANKTLGSWYFRTIYPGSYDNNSVPLGQMVQLIRGRLNYLDLSVSLQNGITYMKQTLGYPLTSVSVMNTVRQAGLFAGDFPMNIEVTGQFEGSLIYKKVTVQQNEVLRTDNSLYSVWASYLISNLRTSAVSQEVKQQISDLSIKYRVLSEYTAFLALEPGQVLCDTCLGQNGGGTVITNIRTKNTAPESYDVMQAYPNPFNPSTTLKIRLPENVDASKTTLVIYNTLGQSVRRFDVSSLSSIAHTQLTWDVRNDNGSTVATGMYLVVLQTPTGRYTMKLMFIK